MVSLTILYVNSFNYLLDIDYDILIRALFIESYYLLFFLVYYSRYLVVFLNVKGTFLLFILI